MFSRLAVVAARASAPRVLSRTPVSRAPVLAISRNFGAHGHAEPAKADGDVVIPELVETLEWVLESPPTVHQFEEPPIVVEIEHLHNLVVEDH